MKLNIDSIKAGPFVYNIRWNYVFKDQPTLWGQIDHAVMEIRIGKGACGEDFAPVRLLATLMHEIMHALEDGMSIKSMVRTKTEDFVEAWSRGTMQLMQDNPKLLALYLSPLVGVE